MKRLNLHYFEHVPYEGLDRIGDWVAARGHRVSVTRFHAGDAIPSLTDKDGLIIMGGPMGVYETDQYPWMRDEMAAIRRAIDAKKKVLGVCLGSQLIAGALGARVYPHTQKEIGWWPVDFSPYPVNDTALEVFGSRAMMYHWHGDTFDMPLGATLLASSQACRHQAYAVGTNVMALQFHPEISAGTISRWVQESGGIQHPQGFVMSETEMRRLAPTHLAALSGPLMSFLDRFFTAAE